MAITETTDAETKAAQQCTALIEQWHADPSASNWDAYLIAVGVYHDLVQQAEDTKGAVALAAVLQAARLVAQRAAECPPALRTPDEDRLIAMLARYDAQEGMPDV